MRAFLTKILHINVVSYRENQPYFHHDEGAISGETPKLPIRVFIAENDVAVVFLLKSTLSPVPNLTADYSDSGQEVLDKMRLAKVAGQGYNLLVTGNHLKEGVVGVEIAQKVMGESLASTVVMLTGSAHEFEECSQAELDEFGLAQIIGKPFLPSVVVQAIEEFRPKTQPLEV
jgi:response regulator of citrate/malate metabolism